MRVVTLAVDPYTSLPVVILRDPAGRTCLPISVGLSEASAIAAELESIELERPMTHQLMGEMLASLGVAVDHVEVTDLVDGTFYATVHLRLPDGDTRAQDARPSDAFALALRTGAAIRVAPHVVDKASHLDLRAEDPHGALFSSPCAEVAPETVSPLTDPRVLVPEGAEFLDGLGDDDFGKWKM
jgi:bifunctional DNase/RNase